MNSSVSGINAPKIGLAACSDALSASRKPEVEALCEYLRQAGYEPVLSPHIYEESLSAAGFAEFADFRSISKGIKKDPDSGIDPLCCYSGTAQQRAAALMDFYRDPSVCAICDISGGDMACELLPYLDFSIIGSSGKKFWGYSDLTTIINAIYTRTGQTSVLYQARYLPFSGAAPAEMTDAFLSCSGRHPGSYSGTNSNINFDAFSDCLPSQMRPSFRFIQGEHISGILVGGNIRCLLKLAGTDFWPDLRGKVLLLESMGGKSALMVSYLSQLKLLHAFEQVSGILLGTFTQMEKEVCLPDICSLVQRFAGPDIPIAKTQDIGHSRSARPICIGDTIELYR